MTPRFGPIDDPLRDQTESEFAQVFEDMMSMLADPRYGQLPRSPDIEDRRWRPTYDDIYDSVTTALPRLPTPPRDRGAYTPTMQDLKVANNTMDMNELYEFFKDFPEYTRALMIHEGRNPSETPNEQAITPDEWEAANRYRKTTIEETGHDDDDEGISFEDRWQGEENRGYP